MFKNLFSFEENENVVEFVEEEVIENEEELDTLLDNVKAIVVNTVKVVVTTGKLAWSLTKLTAAIVTFPVVQAVKAVPSIVDDIKERRKLHKAGNIILKQMAEQRRNK
jgi:predicted GTPase